LGGWWQIFYLLQFKPKLFHTFTFIFHEHHLFWSELVLVKEIKSLAHVIHISTSLVVISNLQETIYGQNLISIAVLNKFGCKFSFCCLKLAAKSLKKGLIDWYAQAVKHLYFIQTLQCVFSLKHVNRTGKSRVPDFDFDFQSRLLTKPYKTAQGGFMEISCKN